MWHTLLSRQTGCSTERVKKVKGNRLIEFEFARSPHFSNWMSAIDQIKLATAIIECYLYQSSLITSHNYSQHIHIHVRTYIFTLFEKLHQIRCLSVTPHFQQKGYIVTTCIQYPIIFDLVTNIKVLLWVIKGLWDTNKIKILRYIKWPESKFKPSLSLQIAFVTPLVVDNQKVMELCTL